MTRHAKPARRPVRARNFAFPIQHRPMPRSLMATTALASTYLIMAGVLQMASAQSLPTGGTVAAGTVTINQPSANRLVINQYSGTAITNWQSFSIGAGNSVAVVQPSTSASMLARVNGSTTSTIAGSLTATGQLMLVNPNGISITPTGTINAGGGFVATSLGISNDDFLAGKRTFTGTGASNAVTNAGTITVGPGGYAALIGGTVANSGTISVPAGRVGLGSGEVATLDFSGDGFLQVGVPTNASGTGALVGNSGRIIANGGTVEIKAAAARDAARQAINMSGVVEARSVSGTDGNISLDGSDGAVVVSGKLNAASRRTHGGTITVTGRDVKLTGAKLDASGKLGGGTVLIGGDKQGKGTLAHATTTTIDAATTIKADAAQTGNGGTVVVWSDSQTNFDGWISAKGGTLGGDGGSAEVSSHGVLSYAGTTVLTAPHGATGTLLLDPYNVTISSAADSGTPLGNGTTTAGQTSVINVTTLQNALASANVTISTGAAGSPGTDAGDITVANAITWSAGHTLELDAANNINVNAPVTFGGTAGAALTLNAGSALTITAPIAVNGTGAVSLAYNTTFNTNLSFGLTSSGFSGSLTYLDGNGNATSSNAGGTLSINGAPYQLIYNLGQLGSASATDLTGIDQTSDTATYALARNLSGAGTTYQGSLIANNFTGTLTGLGHTIDSLTITATAAPHTGLIGTLVTHGTLRDIGVTSGSVNGHDMNGGSSTGGLAGFLSGTIVSSFDRASVANGDDVGGLAGTVFGGGAVKSITSSYSTGAVTGPGDVGGIAGYLLSTITSSYATGAVTGTAGSDGVGGLVGYGGFIVSSFATGAVTGPLDVGGLAGFNARITASYATGAVTGTTNVGGLMGAAGTVSASYATGAVTGTTNVGGLVGLDSSISASYATGAVTGSTNVGGLVGNAYYVTSSFWDTSTTGQTNGYGTIDNTNYFAASFNATGLTTAQMRDGSSVASLSPGFTVTAGLYPYLPWQFSSTPQAISGFAYSNSGVTPLTSGTQGANSVFVSIGGSTASATTGANGYYYIVEPAGTLPAGGTAALAYTTADNTATGTATGARLAALTGTSTGYDIWGSTLIAPTSATTLSAAPNAGALITENSAVLTSAAGNGGPSGLGSLNSAGYIATGASFTLDTAIPASGLYVETSTGDINVNTAQTVAAGTGLTLHSAGAIAINAPVTVDGAGAVRLAYNAASPANLSFGMTGSGFAGSLTYLDGSGNATSTDAGGTLSINGAPYALVYSVAQLDAIDGYSAATGAAIAIYGNGPAGNYALAGNLSAAGTTYPNALAGANVNEVDSGTTGVIQYTGTFTGLGHAVDSLSITTNAAYGGLFGIVGAGGMVRDISVTNAQVYGLSEVGTLAGANSGTIFGTAASGHIPGGIDAGGLVGINNGLIANSNASTVVTGSDNAGGLVGYNTGTISASSASGVVGVYSLNGGGLVGGNEGAIVNSSASGAVNALYIPAGSGHDVLYAGTVGGLAGYSDGTISGSFATGAVTGYDFVGGLMGQGSASITSSYATGNVTSLITDSAIGSDKIGGLIGLLTHGAIAGSYATGNVTSPGNFVGGLVGYVASSTMTGSYATGAVNGTGNFVGGLVGVTGLTTITSSYATGNVTSGGFYVGGLIGANGSSNVTGSYATGNVTGASNVGGLIGVINDTSTMLGFPDAGGSQAGSTIATSYATGAVAGSGYVGGLIGYSAEVDNVVQQSYASGVVTNPSGQFTGGLVGRNSGIIEDAYATGAVISAGTYVGGLVGFNTAGTISTSFSTGAVSGMGYTGGLVGRNNGGTIANSYWDTETSGRAIGIGLDNFSQPVTGLTTAQFQDGTSANGLGASFTLSAGFYPYLTTFFPNGTQAVSGIAYSDNGTTPLASGVNGAGLVGVNAGTASQTVSTGANGYYYAVFANGTIDSSNGTNVLAYTQANPQTGAQNSATFTAKATGSLTGFTIAGGTLNEVADAGIASLAALNAAYAATATGTPASSLVFSNLTITAAANGFTIDRSVSNTGAISIASAGGITIASGATVSGSSVTLVAPGAFINNEGPDAVTATSGNWLIYSASPSGDTFGGLNSNNTAVWNTVAGGTVTATGNAYVFAYAPTLTVATVNAAKTYGVDATNAVANDYVITGFQPSVSGAYLGDTLANVVTGAPAVTSTGSGSTVGVGSYGYQLGLGSLAASAGYSFAQQNTAAFMVNSRPITITANAQTQTYGNATPTLTYAVGGLVNNDTLSGSLATTASSTAGVGSYAITQGSLANANYAITYTGANDVIGQRAISVTANAQTQTYGNATPTLTYTVGGLGLVNSDTLSGTLATTATSTASVGSYAITQNTLAASGNYALTYVGANDVIGPRALTVTANAQTQIYGNAMPTLTYTVGGMGLVNGDKLSGALATTASSIANVGSYAITQGTLAASPNYVVTYVGADDVIGYRAITVSADAKTQIYGNPVPPLTYTVGGFGLVNNDILSGGLATAATSASKVGSYVITQGTLANSNYAIVYTYANDVIGARAITVTANAQSRFFGTANPALTYTVGGLGLVDGDLLSGQLATSATSVSPIGDYAINQGTLAGSASYALIYQAAVLTIKPNSPPSSTFDNSNQSATAFSISPAAPSAAVSDNGSYSGFTSPGYDKPSACVGGRACTGP